MTNQEHPYFTGYAAGATGGKYVNAYEAWRYRAGHRSVALYAADFTAGYADGRSVALRLTGETR